MNDVSSGQVLADRYCLLAKLGQGGMGSVWRAVDRVLRIDVAIKLVDSSLVESSEASARFEREAFSSASLRSTHIVHINDFGIDQATGRAYIAMDLLEGESLSSCLMTQGRLGFARTQQVLSQVSLALELAHAKGIVHRDLKPDNIFLAREGNSEVVKVLDFGVSKRLDAQSTSSDIQTRAGQLLGTPFYMSPEQARVKGDVDQRTDIWAFGVIAFECITGHRPFHGDDLVSLLLAICSGTSPVPSHVAVVPVGFDEWFARAVSLDVNARFQTIADAAAALNALTDTRMGERSELNDLGKTTVVEPVEAVGPKGLVESLGPSLISTSNASEAHLKNRWVFASALLVVVVVASIGTYRLAARSAQSPLSATAVDTASALPLVQTSNVAISATNPANPDANQHVSLSGNSQPVVPVLGSSSSSVTATGTNAVQRKPLSGNVSPKPPASGVSPSRKAKYDPGI